MGFTAQMTAWQEGFCGLLADGGRFVIRYDNRDCGLSTKLDDAAVDPMAVMGAVLSGTQLPEVPYTCPPWRPTASGCSTISASNAPTSSEPRWAA
jgi:pimeloyl-ACP methyl ester carboxylesterase